MKKSDKILLFVFLSLLGLYALIHLSLYIRFKQGKIIKDLKTDEGWISRYKGQAPTLVSLEGNVNVRLLPSDSFYIEYHAEDSMKIKFSPLSADSLQIRGGGIDINPHEMFQRYSDFPWVDVHADMRTRIRMNGVLALVKGSKEAGHVQWDLQAINTQLWIGESYGNDADMHASEHYDSLQIQATNVKLELHRNAIIGKLDIRLDNQSELCDQHATISKPEIYYTEGSRVNLTGINLDKLRGMR